MLKKNRIYNISYIDFLKNIDNESIDLVLTDPPYGINYQNNNVIASKHEVLYNDNKFFSYEQLANESYRVLKNNTAILVYTHWSTFSIHFEEIKSAGFLLKEPLIVQKRPSIIGGVHTSWDTNGDWIIFATKGKPTFKLSNLLKNKYAGVNRKGRTVAEFKSRFPSCWFGDSFPYSTEHYTKNIDHPTPKTVELMRWLIQIFTDKGGLIIDPFVGSGTTAIAAIETSRNFIASEIDEKYYSLALNRINKTTATYIKTESLKGIFD